MRKLLATLLALTALAGCGTIPPNTMELVVESNPPAAAAYAPSGKFLGITPFKLYYPLTQADIAANFVSGGTLTVVWNSGARATKNTDVRLNGLTSGTVTFRVERPANAPGLLQDIAFAENRQRQENADSLAAMAAVAGAFAAGRQATPPVPQFRPIGASPNGAQPTTRPRAAWTGGSRPGLTVTGQAGVSCEYLYAGNSFWRAFVGGACPATVEVQ